VRGILTRIANSPRWRLAVTIVGTLIVSIVSAIYAIQIAPNGVIAWSKLTRVSSFWPLIIAALIWLAINLTFLGFDEAIQRFADDEYCVAFVRATNLQAYARLLNTDNRDGHVQVTLSIGYSYIDVSTLER
jgi:hypothetical protein